MELLTVPQGQFSLSRYPRRKGELLRAWDAADEFVLRHLAAMDALPQAPSVLIVNDSFGAIATALAASDGFGGPTAGLGLRLSSLGDSYIAHAATEQNLAANDIDPGAVPRLSIESPLPESVDVVVVKVPRSLSLLDDQLCRIAPHLRGTSVVVAAAMTKNIHTSTLELFDRIIGATTTSLAEKKARLIFSTVNRERPAVSSGWPKTFALDHPSAPKVIVHTHAGVFAADRLDLGTRFLLDHLTHRSEAETIVDLGCGNGIFGTVCAIRNCDAEVVFVDESYMAVASAKATFGANVGPDLRARFIVGNGLLDLDEDTATEPLEPGSIDKVVCNPPFHVDNSVGDATAWQMFSDARHMLRPGGELWVVGNRHLAYHAKLKRLFGDCQVVAGSAKFVVLKAVRR